MAYTFFYISSACTLLLLIIVSYLKPLMLSNIIIGIASIAYSILFDITMGDRLGLYYYISIEKSTLYIMLGAVLVYSPLNVIYTVFAPTAVKQLFEYTAVWILAMLLFEYVSLLTQTIVFTGWKPLPWSPVVYIFTYSWINIFYRYLNRRLTANFFI